MSDHSSATSTAGTVADLLSRGVWVAKIDARRNRTYYVNPHTGQSVWDLGRHLARAQTGGDALSGQSSIGLAAVSSPRGASEADRSKVATAEAADAQAMAAEQERLNDAIDTLLLRRGARVRRAHELYGELGNAQGALARRRAQKVSHKEDDSVADTGKLTLAAPVRHAVTPSPRAVLMTAPPSSFVLPSLDEMRARVLRRACDVLQLREQGARVELEATCLRVYHSLHRWHLAAHCLLADSCALSVANNAGGAAACVTHCVQQDEQSVVTQLRHDEAHMRVLACMAEALLQWH